MGFLALLSGVGRTFSKLWTLAVLLAAGAAGINATSTALQPLTQTWSTREVVDVVVYLFQLLVCVVIHELGHVAGAKLAGWRVQSIAVGPFAYLPNKHRIVVVRQNASGLISGLVKASPLASPTLIGSIIFMSGGCVANFIFAAATSPYLHSLQVNWYGVSTWSALLGAWSIISLLIGFANLVPFAGFKGVRSDGYRLVALVVLRLWPAMALPRRTGRGPA